MSRINYQSKLFVRDSYLGMVVYYILCFPLQHLHKVFLHTLVRYKLFFCFWILLHISYCTLCTLPKVPIYRRLKWENVKVTYFNCNEVSTMQLAHQFQIIFQFQIIKFKVYFNYNVVSIIQLGDHLINFNHYFNYNIVNTMHLVAKFINFKQYFN